MVAAKPEVVSNFDPRCIIDAVSKNMAGFKAHKFNRSVANGVSVTGNVCFQHGCRQTAGFDMDALPCKCNVGF